MFSVNRSTGEVDGVFPRTKEAIDNPDPAAYQSLAEETAGQFIPIEEYTLSVEDQGEGIRAFHYFRVIDGVAAWDRIEKTVAESGRKASFAGALIRSGLSFPGYLQTARDFYRLFASIRVYRV